MGNAWRATLALVVFVTQFAFAEGRFPQGPDPQLTPGSLCGSPDQFRYPEHIAYCRRDVDSQLKKSIIRAYDSERGFEISSMPRGQFKIDHLIPLCMGGSNERENLWPQHRSVFELTDPMEPLMCEKMAEGVLRQSEAVELIRRGKDHLDQIPEIMAYVNNL